LEAEAYAEVATPSRDMSVNTMLRGFTDGSLKELANGSMDELVHRFEKAERARMRRENAMEDPLCKQKRLDRIAKKLTEMGLEVKAIDRQGDMSVNVNKVLYD
jgi:hypothetical protein